MNRTYPNERRRAWAHAEKMCRSISDSNERSHAESKAFDYEFSRLVKLSENNIKKIRRGDTKKYKTKTYDTSSAPKTHCSFNKICTYT